MSQLDTPNENIDPIIAAALIEDPDEDDEDKKLREELLGTTDTSGKATQDADEDEDEQDDDDEEDQDNPDKKSKKSTDSDDEDSDDEDEDEDDKKSDPKNPKKPIEAQDDEEDSDDEDQDDDDKKVTRREKRQQRREAFFKSILKDQPQRSSRQQNLPDYKPLNYDEAPDDGYKTDELVQDREMHGAIQFVKGAEEARYWANQDRFWGDLKTETRILAYDQDLNFLSEKLPNGKENPKFDPDKTSEINEMYLQLVGFKQYQRTDEQGRPQFDQNGNPILISTVGRTDVSYEKFARRYVENMTNWANERADEREDEVKDNITKQRKKQGIRPNGGKRKTLGALKPGDISNMSDEEFEKYEAEIDRQILNML